MCTEELLERVDGDLAFIAELLELLRGDYPDQFEAMQEAVASDDFEALQQLAHALKGALGNLAAPIAAGISGELETLARSGDITRAGALLAELSDEMHRVVDQLEALCLEPVQ